MRHLIFGLCPPGAYGASQGARAAAGAAGEHPRRVPRAPGGSGRTAVRTAGEAGGEKLFEVEWVGVAVWELEWGPRVDDDE